MDVFVWILLAAILDSLLGLIGVFSMFISQRKFQTLIGILVAFAAGAILAGGVGHLFVEGISHLGSKLSVHLFLFGFVSFFILERILHWHHCHKMKCEVHPVGYLILLGDGVHNIVDGLVIASTFLVSVPLGLLTTIMIMAHEIPQELGNYAVTVYSGFSKIKALLYNFLAQSTCLLGAILGYFLSSSFNYYYLLPFAAGGFVYIAASDLVPMLHEEKDLKKSLISLGVMLLGIAFIIVVGEFV